MKNKKILRFAVITALLFCTAGCVAVPNGSPNTTVNGSSFYTEASAVTTSVTTSALTSSSILNIVPGRPKDETTLSSQPNEPIEKQGSEIIMAEIQGDNRYNINVYSINSENSNKTAISSFSFGFSMIYNSSGRSFYNFLPAQAYSAAPLNGFFSSDYKFLAITRCYQGTAEFQAGFIDETGAFWDVANVMPQKSDFDEPVSYKAIGFTDDDRFIFAEIPYTPSLFVSGEMDFNLEYTIYQVKVQLGKGMLKNTVTPFYDLDNMIGHNWDWLERNCEVTDWVDKNTCIVNYPDKYRLDFKEGTRKDVSRWGVYLFNNNTKESTPLVSSAARTNWSGVVSPDGQNVAFLSAPSTDGNASIYYTSVNGGEPKKIYDGISVGRSSISLNVPSRLHINDMLSKNASTVFLLDWK